LTHLLPGEQSVSNVHATACTLESANAKAASLYFVQIFFVNIIINSLGFDRRGQAACARAQHH